MNSSNIYIKYEYIKIILFFIELIQMREYIRVTTKLEEGA